jgi:hypothetical protein
VKFRRRSPEQAAPAEQAQEVEESADAAPAPGPRAEGPWDSSEVDLEEGDPTRVDLGGLVVKGRPGVELRLQVDEKSQQVAAVLLVGTEGALELRPFAAPRNGGTWDDIRKQIAAETARRGGTATEAEGLFGTELRVMMPAKTPEGKPATQPSRVLGVEGPRWLLRATLLGRPAVEPDADHELVRAMRDVVVVRGRSPMAPGEPIPLVMPSNARPARGEDA